MEANVNAGEQVVENEKKTEIVAQGESIIQERVRQEVEKVKAEISGSSAIIAAVLGVLLANAFTYMQKLPFSGDYKYLWATLIGLVLGAVLGERIMLVGFGVLVGLKLAAF